MQVDWSGEAYVPAAHCVQARLEAWETHPAGHWMHADRLAAAYDAAGHTEQSVLPGELEMEPFGHDVQFCDPGDTENDPAGQMEHVDDPAGEEYPAGQAWQLDALVDPEDREDVPAGHDVHEESPVDAPYFPAGHEMHTEMLVAPVALE